MTIENLGEIIYNPTDKEWFGIVNNLCPDNKVELALSVDDPNQDLSGKIELVKSFASDCDTILADLYDYVYKSYNKTIYAKPLEEIQRMYFLTAVYLDNDNKTWHVTLEPNFDVDSIYNHFLRFRLTDRQITWSNL